MKKAVILFNLGGPDKLESVEPFLFNLFNDPAIINIPSFFRYPIAKFVSKRRAPIAKNIYKEIGNRSPILELTQDQAKSLESNLSDKGNYKCFVVMRCWHPRAADVIKKVKEYNPDEIILLSVARLLTTRVYVPDVAALVVVMLITLLVSEELLFEKTLLLTIKRFSVFSEVTTLLNVCNLLFNS